jgi:pSer/pThr/pTyr-binding forkhead associated (FHA) protein
MQVNLKVLVGKSVGKEITVPVKHFLIGRSEDCHLRPKSDAISRNHCAILTQDEKVVLRDLNSRNGTFLNGERISGDVEVHSGDHVQVGKLEFEIVIQVPKKTKTKKAKAQPAGQTISHDPESLDFDISEWLEEGENKRRESEPETRQFQLDETDRLRLAEASAAAEAEEPEKGGKRPAKAAPGKLPPRPASNASSSREAAADMLKKFFNSR